MPSVVFIVVELIFLAVAHCFGGPPWAVIGALAVVLLALGGIRIESLALMVPSLAWLGLSHATGNRELFFPYTMYLASCVALRATERAPWLGPLGGAAIVAAFMVIRILQQATVRVLVVEFVVAAAILALVVVAGSWSRRRVAHVASPAHFGWRAAIVVASSLLAYASLAI
ncbi:MAG: hypothetical protein NTY17_08895 [Planctomycetia bacterium]|nr:hypothetical protein [Planctomycetia bacterium]